MVVTSLQQTRALEPSHPSGKRLMDLGDVVIDLCTPPADALVPLDHGHPPVGPGSTLAYVTVVNAVKSRAAHLLVERGQMRPTIQHPSIAGPTASAASIDAVLADHRRRLRGSDA